jgi:hypothetical protein
MTAITGRPSSKRLQSSTNDLREPDNFVTVLPIGSNRNALDVLPMGVYELLNSVAVESGSTNEIVKYTAHGAKKGDLVRIESSANSIEEFEVSIKEVIDANNFRLAAILSASLTAGDTISVLRPIAQKLSADGTTLASIGSSPVEFILDGVSTPVEKDTTTPSNTVGLPVQIVSGSGTDINITAGDINIQTSHVGASFDSMRIGDGTDLLSINGSGEASVNDADANAALLLIASDMDTVASAVDVVGGAHSAEGIMVLGSDGSLSKRLRLDTDGRAEVIVNSAALPTGAATLAEQQAQTTLLTDIETNTTGLATQATLAAVAAQLPANLGIKSEAASFAVTLSTENKATLASIDTSLNNLEAAVSGSELQVDIVSAGPIATEATLAALAAEDFATEATLAAASAKLPASLGSKASANSFSVVLSTDHPELPAMAVPAAQTLKQAAVAFGTTAVRLTHDGNAPDADRRSLKFIIEPPAGDVNYYAGSSSVTSSGANRGIRLYPGTLYDWPNDPNDWYIISDTVTQTVFVTEAE